MDTIFERTRDLNERGKKVDILTVDNHCDGIYLYQKMEAGGHPRAERVKDMLEWNGWGTNSKGRAKGNKQVDLREGAIYIYLHEEAGHGVSVAQSMAFTDGSIGLRFMLEDEKDALG